MGLQTYLQYNDPTIYHWRKGDPSDPYKHRFDSLPVINGIITLMEIPSETEKVKIAGLTEIFSDEKIDEIASNQFLVNYSNGVIQFHPSQEGKIFLCEYWGKGYVLIPSSRVYAMVQRNPDIVKTLQDIIDEIYKQLKDNLTSVSNLQNIIQETTNVINNANQATDNAIKAKNDTVHAIEEALNAADSTVMVYKGSVQTFDDIDTAFPTPENGWRVMVESTGDIYRYDGTLGKWIFIENWTGGAIPLASDTSDGLMNKTDYKKFHDKLEYKSIVFVLPNIKYLGIQKPLIRFPFDGEILSAYVFCSEEALVENSVLVVEKVSETDFLLGNLWLNACDITLLKGENKSSLNTINISQVQSGDYFRINLYQKDSNITNMTIQIDIKI